MRRPPIQRWLPVPCVVLMLASGGSAMAFDGIDASLDDLARVRIVSMPKFAENPDRIPSVVSVLTAQDIRTHGWRTLGDALRSLQGFNITEDHTYSYAGIRGVAPPGDYRPRMRILIDGISVNDNLYASVPVDSAFPLDVGLIERIEVIRGPSASVYGGDAMFGVVNVVTRGGQAVAGGEAVASMGSGDRRQLRASWSGQVGGAEALLSATSFRAHGRSLRVDDLGDADLRLRRVAGEEGEQLFIKARGVDWRFSFLHAERERVVPTGSYATIPNDRGHVETDRYSLLGLAKDWKFGAFNTFQQQLFAGRYGYDGRFPYDYSPDDPRLINVDRARGAWWGLENRLINTRWSGHRLTMGLEYRADTRQDQRNYDKGYGCFETGGATCLDDRRRGHQTTFIAQDEMQVGAATVATLGLRHDRQGSLGSFWSPRLGLVHDADELGLFKLLYGSAFRTPSVYERAYLTPTFSYGNPDLRSEKMKSLDVSWEKRFGPRSRVTVSAYHFDIERMVSTDPDTGLAYNASKVSASGLEIEYERQWLAGARLRTGYSLQHASDRGGQLDNSPRHMVKLALALPAGLPNLTAGIEGQWVSRRLAAYGTQSVAAYGVANINLAYQSVGKRWDLALGIYNLFDRRYADPVSPDTTVTGDRWRMWQFGRTFQLTGTLRF